MAEQVPVRVKVTFPPTMVDALREKLDELGVDTDAVDTALGEIEEGFEIDQDQSLGHFVLREGNARKLPDELDNPDTFEGKTLKIPKITVNVWESCLFEAEKEIKEGAGVNCADSAAAALIGGLKRGIALAILKAAGHEDYYTDQESYFDDSCFTVELPEEATLEDTVVE